MTGPSNRLAVVHLVRHANGIEPLRAFLESYRNHRPGIDHDLILLFKGFDNEVPSEYAGALVGLEHRVVHVADVGVDIASYRIVAAQLDYDHYCYLNSFSVILADDWLAKLRGALNREVVAVSASGSWESLYTSYVGGIRSAATRPTAYKKPISEMVVGVLRVMELRAKFRPFPNPHLRTNALLISRELFLKVTARRLQTKVDAMTFESGRRGLSALFLERDHSVAVVGRDGMVYGPSQFRASHTFRTGDQCNLLVADNRTREFEAADREWRRASARVTWGSEDAESECPRVASAKME